MTRQVISNGPTCKSLQEKTRPADIQKAAQMRRQWMETKLNTEDVVQDLKDLERELDDAKNIKRGIIEKGESASLKADLLNEELAGARNRIDSLEKALILLFCQFEQHPPYRVLF